MATSNDTAPGLVDRIRLPLVAVGVFAILAGLAYWFVQGEFNIVARVLVAGGILLLGIFVAIDPEDIWRSMTGRAAVYGGNALLIGVASILILGLVNVLGSRYGNKVDLTANKQFTLSEQSIKVAESLPQPIKATAFFQNSDPSKSTFEELLGNYASHSNGNLTYEFVDPDQQPSVANQAGIRQYETTVLQMGDKKQNITGTGEQDVTTALIKLTRPSKKIYFTTGHGERNTEGFDRQDYGQVKQALERDNFTVSTVNLAATRTVPTDADELVIAGPTNPFLPEEMQAVQAYVGNGGRVILLLGPGTKADFSDILKQWDVTVTGNPVFDPGAALGGDPGVPIVVPPYPFHVVTQTLDLATFFVNPTNFDVPPQSPTRSSVVPLAKTTDRSWAESSQQEVQSRQVRLDDQDEKGPLTLALAIEQDVPGSAAQPSQPSQPSPGVRTSRIVMIATPELVANQSLAVSAQAGNLDLFLNAANWEADQSDLVSIRPKDTQNRSLLLTDSQRNLMFLVSVLLIPLGVMAAGIAVWWTRR